MLFLTQKVLPDFSFPPQSIRLQRAQTDRGPEFIGEGFPKALREQKIKFRPNKFRPIKACLPHLNGKVERSQQTDRIEFWATVGCSRPAEALAPDVAARQRYYNAERSHSSLGGKTPQQRLEEVSDTIPSAREVHGHYDPKNEIWQTNWKYTWTFVEG